jgi:hypothetical protein
MPPEVENQINKIRLNLENQEHKASDNKLIIDWLTETYKDNEYEFYSDQNYDYQFVLMKYWFKEDLNDESLAEKYDF